MPVIEDRNNTANNFFIVVATYLIYLLPGPDYMRFNLLMKPLTTFFKSIFKRPVGYEMQMFKQTFFCLILFMPYQLASAEVTIHKNEVSGLLTWTAEDDGFSIELIQLLPDFVRAIYAKHNFPKNEVERAASYCVFGTILKNTSSQHMSYSVSEWRYHTKEQPVKLLPVKTKSQWLEEWQKAGIVFSWTLLPDIGEFEVGDWQQGFTTIKLPRETEFSLIYKWRLDGKVHTGVIENLKCSPESLDESDLNKSSVE